MIIKTGDELHQLVKNVLLAAGADEPNAGGRGRASGFGKPQRC